MTKRGGFKDFFHSLVLLLSLSYSYSLSLSFSFSFFFFFHIALGFSLIFGGYLLLPCLSFLVLDNYIPLVFLALSTSRPFFLYPSFLTIYRRWTQNT